MAEIVHCEQCLRVKEWNDDCSYLTCNPELNWREMTAEDVYSALHPEGVAREALRAENERLRAALRHLRDYKLDDDDFDFVIAQALGEKVA